MNEVMWHFKIHIFSAYFFKCARNSVEMPSFISNEMEFQMKFQNKYIVIDYSSILSCWYRDIQLLLHMVCFIFNQIIYPGHQYISALSRECSSYQGFVFWILWEPMFTQHLVFTRAQLPSLLCREERKPPKSPAYAMNSLTDNKCHFYFPTSLSLPLGPDYKLPNRSLPCSLVKNVSVSYAFLLQWCQSMSKKNKRVVVLSLISALNRSSKIPFCWTPIWRCCASFTLMENQSKNIKHTSHSLKLFLSPFYR